MNFLETKVIPLNGKDVEISQLSGLERFDFLDYCSDIPRPKTPLKPDENAMPEEQEQYIEDMERNLKNWARVNFIGQSRLVAYGYKALDEDLEKRHQIIMASMTPEQVKFLHDEVAKFSGIPLPEPVEDTDKPNSESEETQEPVDPKV